MVEVHRCFGGIYGYLLQDSYKPRGKIKVAMQKRWSTVFIIIGQKPHT
jgi:hypothetical protein